MLNEIIAESKKLIVSEGLSFKLDTLATNLKISKKTIYKHIKNKEEIIRVIINEAFDYTKNLQKEVLKSDMDLIKKIKSIMVIAPLNEEIYNSENMHNLRVYHPTLFNEVNEMLNSDWQVTYDLFEQAKKEGLLRDFNNELFRHLYINGIFFEYKDKTTYQERLNNIIEFLFEGVVVK